MRILKHTIIDKRRGETPLEAIGRWKAANPQYADVRAAYAGRLDPMAEGKLLVLLGDECKNLTAYTKLDKEYQVEILLDLLTDTGDTLGLAEYAHALTTPTPAAARRALSYERGTHLLPYPAFSSKPVQGKPLFLYALEGTLASIVIPEHLEKFYALKLERLDDLTQEQLRARIHESLAVVPVSDEPSKVLGADFRQSTVRSRWDELFKEMPERKFSVLTIRIQCGSGAYMRTLADRVGKSLGTRGLALSIRRTRIGKSIGSRGFRIWPVSY